MIRQGLAVAAVLLLAGCGRSAPGSHPELPRGPYRAAFKARFSGEQGRARVNGLLASGGPGRLRVEIAAGGRALLIVSSAGDLTAVLSGEGLYVHDRSGTGLVESITGLELEFDHLAALLAGVPANLPAGCVEARKGSTSLGEGGRIPRRIVITCTEGRLELRLSDAAPLDPSRAEAAFAPLDPPAHYSEAAVEDLARALREALGRRPETSR